MFGGRVGRGCCWCCSLFASFEHTWCSDETVRRVLPHTALLFNSWQRTDRQINTWMNYYTGVKPEISLPFVVFWGTLESFVSLVIIAHRMLLPGSNWLRFVFLSSFFAPASNLRNSGSQVWGTLWRESYDMYEFSSKTNSRTDDRHRLPEDITYFVQKGVT